MTSGFATSSEHVYHVGHVLMVNFAAWHGHADGPSCQREGGVERRNGGDDDVQDWSHDDVKRCFAKETCCPEPKLFCPKAPLEAYIHDPSHLPVFRALKAIYKSVEAHLVVSG